jgi:ElaB/YqjD/DUF883 family membrane-anchored ribosome-binding protein
MPHDCVIRLEKFDKIKRSNRIMTARKDTAATIEDIRTDIHELRNDIARLAEQATALVSDTGNETLSDVRKRIQRIQDKLGNAVTEKGQEAAGAVLGMTENLGESLEESLRSRPIVTLAAALAIGFLFGVSRQQR